MAVRACQSVLSVAADKTYLSEYSSTSNAMHLKNDIFCPDTGTPTWCFLHVQVGAAALQLQEGGGLDSYFSELSNMHSHAFPNMKVRQKIKITHRYDL